MNAELANRSNYLVAFLAAIIGLAAFKDTLSRWYVMVFANEYTWLSLCVPLICAMLFAAYVGALSHFSSNITFTKLPISRYLGNVSNYSAIIGLLYPIGLLLILLMSYVLEHISSLGNYLDIIYNVSTTVTTIVSVITAAYLAKNISALRSDYEKQAILESFERSLRKNIEAPKGKDKGYQLLYEYEYLHRLMIRSLQFMGYGINSRMNVTQLAEILHKKEILDNKDLDNAARLNKQRNAYAHGQLAISKSELETALRRINGLQKKIKAAIIDRDETKDS